MYNAVISLYQQEEYAYVGFYITHIIFTVYNFLFMLCWEPHYYTEGVFTLISFVISIYVSVAVGLFAMWVYTEEPDPDYVIQIFNFLFYFFIIPGIQSVTYRLYRRHKNKPSQNNAGEVVYVTSAEEPALRML